MSLLWPPSYLHENVDDDDSTLSDDSSSPRHSVVVTVAAAQGQGGDRSMIAAIASSLVPPLLRLSTRDGAETLASLGWRHGNGMRQFTEEASRSLGLRAEIFLAHGLAPARAAQLCASAAAQGHSARTVATPASLLLGHSGEFRGRSRHHRNCCKLGADDDGIHVCAHGKTGWSAPESGDTGVIKGDHWSCCGVRREAGRCTRGLTGAELAATLELERAAAAAAATAAAPVPGGSTGRASAIGPIDTSLRVVLPTLATFLNPVVNERPTAPDAVKRLLRRQCSSDSSGAALGACAICLEDFERGAEMIELDCTHSFHPDCVVPWLEHHNQCPVCRKELPLDTSSAAHIAEEATASDRWVCLGCSLHNPTTSNICESCGASSQICRLVEALDRQVFRPTVVVAAASRVLPRLLAAAEDDARLAAHAAAAAAAGPGASASADGARGSWSHFEALIAVLGLESTDDALSSAVPPPRLCTLEDVEGCARLIAEYKTCENAMLSQLAEQGLNLAPGLTALCPPPEAAPEAVAPGAEEVVSLLRLRLRPRGVRFVSEVDDPFLAAGVEPQRTDLRVLYKHLCAMLNTVERDLDARLARTVLPLIDAIGCINDSSAPSSSPASSSSSISAVELDRVMRPLTLAFEVIKNVMEDPGSEQKRRLRMTKIEAKAQHPLVVPLLRAVGFRVRTREKKKGLYLIMSATEFDAAQSSLTACLGALKVKVGALGEAAQI